MVVMSCPWCEEDTPVDITSFNQEFRCECCGTRTLLAADPDQVLDLAA